MSPGLRRLIVALVVAAVAFWLGSLWGADVAPAGDGSGVRTGTRTVTVALEEVGGRRS